MSTSDGPGGVRGRFGPRPTVGVGSAAGAVSEDISALVRAELALARAEILGGIKAKAVGVALLGVVAALGWFAIMGIFLTLGFVLAEVAGLPGWAAALIITLALVAIAVTLALVARHLLATPVTAETTKDNIQEDVAWTRAHLSR